MSVTAILVRHGSDILGTGDLRGGDLKERGVLQVRDTAKQTIEARICPRLILYSPTLRGERTAEIFVEEYRLAGQEVSMHEDRRLDSQAYSIPATLSD